jgi:predicted nucleic acid-binding protein
MTDKIFIDSNIWIYLFIVAAAKTAGCNLLISEDMHDGLAIDRMRIQNIFSASKSEND